MLIVASANLLGYIFAREQVPQGISELVLGLTTSATVFMLLVFALSMVLGTALDAIAVLTLTVPILLPISADVRRRPDRARRADDRLPDDRPAHPAGGHGDLRPAGHRQGDDVRGVLGLAAVHGPADRCSASASSSGPTRSSTCPRSWACDTAPRRSILAGLVGQGVKPSLTPELHEREAQRQGLRYVYKIIDLPDDRLSEAHLRELLECGRRSSASTGSTSPIRSSRRWCRWSTRSAATSRRSARSTRCSSPTAARRSGTTPTSPASAGRSRRGCPDAELDGLAILGAGGAGTAVAHALVRLGARRVLVLDPDEGRADALVRSVTAAGADVDIRAVAAADLPDALAERPAWSTRPRSAWPPTPARPLAPELLQAHLWVVDIVYRPLETDLLRAARAVGLPDPERRRHGRAPGGGRVRADHRPPRRPRRDVARLRRDGRRRAGPDLRWEPSRERNQKCQLAEFEGEWHWPRAPSFRSWRSPHAAATTKKVRTARSRSRWPTATPRTSRSTGAGPRSSRTRSRRPMSA